MILVDLSHTSHTRARTGIQRVARCLTRELVAASQGAPITWDPHARHWRALENWEQATLACEVPGQSRGTSWPLGARLRGRWRRLSQGGPGLPRTGATGSHSGALLPELFSPAIAAALPALRAAQPGPVVALFHDAIALRRPALFPRQTVARFPAYLRELASLDGVAAVSEDSLRCLSEYWDWLGLRERPPLIRLTPGIDAPVPPPTPAVHETAGAPLPPAAGPELLCLCTLEGRKNHLALLEACESLWTLGHHFSLHLVGLARSESAGEALALIGRLRAAGRPLRHSGVVDEAGLEAAYAACAFTVYPSLEEGYGLPVVESLIRGKPCVCSGNGALGEISLRGGCLSLGGLDAGNLAASLSLLLRSPELLSQLRREAAAREFRSWKSCCDELVAWMGTLPRR